MCDMFNLGVRSATGASVHEARFLVRLDRLDRREWHVVTTILYISVYF